MKGATPAVSVCVSTKNRAAMLSDLFEALAAQDIDAPFEVCVTDNNSSDETFVELQRLQAAMPFPVRVTRNEVPGGPAAGRNRAAALAAAPVLAFTDDDCRPDAGWLRVGLAAISKGHAVVVGRVAPPPGEGSNGHPFARVVASNHWLHFITANIFYRADDFTNAGGFDTEFSAPGGEDTDLGFRVCKSGAEPRYEPAAIVYHLVRQPLVRIAVREASRWHGIPLLVKKHPELRQLMFRHGVIWRESHQWIILALVSLPFVRRSPLFLVGLAPWIWMRLLRFPSNRRRARYLAFAPALALVDTLEVLALIRGSVRDRTFAL